MSSRLALAVPAPVVPIASGPHLVAAALLGIAVIIVAVSAVKLHPFVALILGAATVGAVAGQDLIATATSTSDTLTSFGNGFGSTAASVGILIALGAMFAKLLADSGGADQIVDTIVRRASPRTLPWAMTLVGAIIGLPMFFEIGLVLLMPVIYLVSRRSQLSLIRIGIPALAGLSAMHGLVPPHPGPLAAIKNLDADLGRTLLFGIIVAIPTVIVSGPLFARIAARWVDVEAPSLFQEPLPVADDSRRPGFAVTIFSVLLPVVLMLARAVADLTLTSGGGLRAALDLVGTPMVALLIAVLVGMGTLGRGAGMTRTRISETVHASLAPIAGIFLIVAAGGGFKQVLVDTGIGTVLADWAKGAHISVLLLAWVIAVLIRLATGSATVATITASALLLGVVHGLPANEVSLVVLAVGAGSVFFSHVNDAGFWLVKEYFGLSVGQTFKTWSLMETVLSVSGLGFVLLLSAVV